MRKKVLAWILILIMLCGVTACNKSENAQSGEYKEAKAALEAQELLLDGSNEVSEDLLIALKAAPYVEPKNIIFMIGDGMGYSATEAAQAYYKDKLYEGTLAMYHMPVQGTQTTYSMNNQITDSAAGGTALSTGYKTGNRIVGKSLDKTKDYKTTLELAAEKGKSTGIVVTTPVVDATPADFTAHVDDRESYEKIAAQQLEKLADGTLDLALGGGRTYYECEENTGLLEKAKKAGVTYTNAWEDTAKAKLPVVGLYAEKELDTTDENMPSVAKMTDYALNQLSGDEDGFFLMVEGAQIDDFAEKNNLEMELHEIYEFDCAIAVAMRYVALHPDTVLIITADHETGDVENPKEQSSDKVLEQTTYSTELHTYKSVPVLAAGYRTEELSGTHENTDIGIFVASLLGEKEFGAKSTTKVAVDYSKKGEAVTLSGSDNIYKLPMEELQKAAEDMKAVKILHVTFENNTEEVQRLPQLQFKYRMKEYAVKPQKGYIKPGETIQVDYPMPEKTWSKKLLSTISDPILMVEQESASYLLKDIKITSRTGLR